MIFLETVCKEVKIHTEDKTRYLTIELDPIDINSFIANVSNSIIKQATLYPFHLTITEHEEFKDTDPLWSTLSKHCKSECLLCGQIFLTTLENQKFKENPLDFCFTNNLLSLQESDHNET